MTSYAHPQSITQYGPELYPYISEDDENCSRFEILKCDIHKLICKPDLNIIKMAMQEMTHFRERIYQLAMRMDPENRKSLRNQVPYYRKNRFLISNSLYCTNITMMIQSMFDFGFESFPKKNIYGPLYFSKTDAKLNKGVLSLLFTNNPISFVLPYNMQTHIAETQWKFHRVEIAILGDERYELSITTYKPKRKAT